MYPLRRYLIRICIVFIITPLLISLMYSVGFFTNSMSDLASTATVRQTIFPDIFDLSLWRHILLSGPANQTLCPVPHHSRPIANAYCRAHNREKCHKIPCTLIYLSDEFTKNVECLRGGKLAIGVEPDWICRKSPALELFSNPQRQPSVIAEVYTALTSELFSKTLATNRDRKTSKWGLTIEDESIEYFLSVANKREILSLFDITRGYDRRYFDLITNVHLTDYVNQITNKWNQRLTIEQVLRNKIKDRAPILWIYNNCDTSSNRTANIFELMRYIHIDVRGKCGNPNWNQSSIAFDPKRLAKENTALIREYLFTIAIENNSEYDYVTDKLWQPLAAGSVPIYLGAPNIKQWLPCSDYSCIINLRQFTSMRDVANLINHLIQQKEGYIQYHQWRNEKKMRPTFIKMVNYFRQANKHSIECLICDMVYRHNYERTRRKLLAANNPFNDIFPSLAEQ